MEDPALSSSADDSDLSPQIQQNVEGDGNLVIVEMKGGTAFNGVNGDVSIYNYYHREDSQILIDSAESVESDQLPCPYRGLFNFESGDAKYFFGRESFVEELVQATQTRNFIPLLGASGSGKSSVVFAGLIPKLQQTGQWQFTYFRPDADPFYALAEALVPLYRSELDSTDSLTQAVKLSEGLKNGITTLAHVFRSIQRKHPNHRVLLIADQFEQLYTLCADETTRHNFLDKLLTGIFSPADQTPFAPVLVATMRADFFSTAILYSPFADVLQNANLILKPMDRSELTKIIEKPAQMLGVTFEAGLVKRILDDVEKEPGILPLLEFALTELWQRRSNNQLTHAAYGEIGEVQGALDLRATQEYAKFSEVDRELVRHIFIQLVRPGEGAEDTRRVAMKGELGEESWFLVKQLADARLVVTSQNASGQETVEVVHEALIRNWGELRGWMEIDRVFRAWQERLRGAMRQWETHRDEDSLWRGVTLIEAEEQLQKRPKNLSNAEIEFIELSLQTQKRIKKAELEKEERSQKVEVERRKREIRITRGIASGSLVVVALGIMTVTSLVSQSLLYDQYVYCPEIKGRPGKKIEDTCFRQVKTSGEVGVFLSSTNFHLDKGVDAFRQGDQADKQRNHESAKKLYETAEKLFKQAVDSDLSDPIPRIFLNNTRARLRNSLPIKLAVVASMDYYETAAKNVLRGVADAQDKFNEDSSNTGSLMEIVIVNDENEPKVAIEVAQELVNDKSIKGIIGHHASESTIAAQKIYEQNKIAVISPTSSSSKLKGENFFRTVGGSMKSAELYSKYVVEVLKLNSITIFYVENSDYSRVLKNNFKQWFLKKGGNTKDIQITSDIDIEQEINMALKKGDKALLIFSNVKTNSVAIAISRKNLERKKVTPQ